VHNLVSKSLHRSLHVTPVIDFGMKRHLCGWLFCNLSAVVTHTIACGQRVSTSEETGVSGQPQYHTRRTLYLLLTVVT